MPPVAAGGRRNPRRDATAYDDGDARFDPMMSAAVTHSVT